MKITQRTVTQMRRLFAEGGLTQKAIAERFGVNPSTVEYHLSPNRRAKMLADRRSPRPPGQRPRLTLEQVSEIRALYAEGRSMSEIAKRVGLSKPGVAYHVRGVVREREEA